jgi:outer membrane receptor protein involved in Fe transport
MTKAILGGGSSLFALLLGLGAALPASAEDASVSEVVVTGSYIQGTPEDAALPVSVIGAEEMREQGAPTVTELFRNLPEAQGLIGESNQFDTRGGQSSVGVTTINLRGLGATRTLVLLNGRRHVADDLIGVDVLSFPTNALARVEVLKDGAAALYGSDAIGGVVNFITRKSVDGLEISASHQFIDGSDGDSEVGVAVGGNGERADWIIAAQYSHRGQLRVRDREWALRPFADNPEGGWSSIGHPGTFVNPVTFAFVPDPQCNTLGGFNDGFFCRFQYTYFDNLTEETKVGKLYAGVDFELGSSTLHLEGLVAKSLAPHYATSPAYPPQSLLNTFVPASHPALQDMVTRYPAFGAAIGNGTLPSIFWGRYAGVDGINGGNAQSQRIEIDTMRLAASLTGPLAEKMNYTVSASYSRRESYYGISDMYVERFALALNGLGGPSCTPSTGTPGVGPCMYYNPFSTAIATSAVTGGANPGFVPSLANDPALLDWLVGRLESWTTNDLFVADAVVSGETPWSLSGGAISYAVGGQVRREGYKLELNDLTDLSVNPCPFRDPFSVTLGLTPSLNCVGETGLFAFLSGSTEQTFHRNIFGAFAELALPFSDTFDVQLAVRYEDYGGGVGSTIDPKVAARWQVTPNIAIRGSASTTFRGPPQSSLSGRGTALAFVGPTLAFKAIDTIGNPNLEPERAIATNLGVLLKFGGFSGSVDYWRFDFDKPFQVENYDQIVNAYINNDCADGGVGVGSPTCSALRAHIFPLGVSPGGIERIEVSVINGSKIVTSGIDFAAQYEWQWGTSTMAVGLNGTYTINYESEDFVDRNGVRLAPGGDFVGFLNEGTPFQPLLDLRGSVYATWSNGPHSLRYTLRYTDSYTDVAPSLPRLGKIDSQVTHDITYNLELFGGATRLTASVFNITDEDPPQTSSDVNYDPYTHSAFGRMFKIGVTQRF